MEGFFFIVMSFAIIFDEEEKDTRIKNHVQK